MSSIIERFQKRSSVSLPVCKPEQQQQQQQELRRRLSSISLKIQPPTSWAKFGRSKSVSSSMGEYAGSSSLKKWWDWGFSWLLSRRPVFAKDLEMNEEETNILGSHNKGSWRHVFFKVRSEFKKIVRSDKVGLPQTYSYDSFSYSKNFEDGITTMKIQH